MQEKHTIKAAHRKITGKKLRHLRKQGILPANIYGKGVESTAIELPLQEFIQLFDQVGETGVVFVNIDGTERPTLIHSVQEDYLTHQPIHADFYQVNLKEKVKTMVPLELVGDAQAVADKVGMLLHTLNEVEVEALPTDLPEKVEVDVTHLAALNDQVTVADLKVPSVVTILTNPEEVVAKIAELVAAEPEPVAEEVTEPEVIGQEGEATEEGAESTQAPAEEEK